MLVAKQTRGRPTVFDPDTVRKLEQAFAIGCSVAEACSVSGVSRSAYYKHLEDDEQFMDRMERAKLYLAIQARHTVALAVRDGDIKASMWYLERKRRGEFGGVAPAIIQSGHMVGLTDEELHMLTATVARTEKTSLL